MQIRRDGGSRTIAVDAGLRVAGAGLLAATAAMHLDLYLTGFRNIPTIGGLFLLQIIAAFVLALAVLATGHWLAAAAGAGFALATLAGWLLSVWAGLFGFKEVRTTAGIVAGLIEVAAFAVLGTMIVLAIRRGKVPGPLLRAVPQALVRGAVQVVGALSVLALVLLGVAAATSGQAAAPAAGGHGAVLKTTRIGGVLVLTNAKGLTVYWFAPDTATRSNCNGSCAAYWPPVKGGVSAGPGVTGRIGTIKRADGSSQATYNGHPLYTYIADSAPGQAKGNNLNLNGGLWHEVTVSG
jgi:predicted lipoprotein with Yx(FWY)xxD motif